MPIGPEMTSRRVTFVSGLFAVAVSAMALIGWSLQIDALKGIVLGSVAMNPTVAILLMIVAICLLLTAPAMAWPRRILGVAVFLMAALKLIDIITGTDIGVDRVAMGGQLAIADPFFGNPMATTTALCLAALSAGLLCGEFNIRRGAKAGAAIAGLIAGAALLGFILNQRALINPTLYYPMALNTALTILALATGIWKKS